MIIITLILYTHSTLSCPYFIIYSFPSARMQGAVSFLIFYFIIIHFLPHACKALYLIFSFVLLFINFLFISNALVNISSLVYNLSSFASHLFLFYSLFPFFILNVLIIDAQFILIYLYCRLINLSVKCFIYFICKLV